MKEKRISLRSGTWSWQVTGSGGGTAPGNAVLHLQDPDSPNDWMTRALPAGTEPASLEGEALESLARNPDLRQVTGPEGEIWSVERIPAPDSIKSDDVDVDRAPLRIQVTRAGDPPHLLQLPEGKALGEMQGEELLSLLGSAGAGGR